MKRDNLIPIVLVLALGALFVPLSSYLQHYTDNQATLVQKYFSITAILFIVFAAMVLSLLLSKNLLVLARQKRTMELQNTYIGHLQEMMQVIKAQRHDFINHLQVVYGLLRIGENDQAQEYIGEIYQDVQVSGEILRLGIPELTALLMVKMGVATARGIPLSISVESDLKGLAVRPVDIAAIVGNLLNNAMEAVEEINLPFRTVSLIINENTHYFVIQTRNPGFIPPDIRDQVFKAGFSTKGESLERGVGLTSVKHLVEKYRGKILLSSHPENGTRFTVCFPKSKKA